MLSRCGHFLLVTLVRFRYHEPCMNCGCICFEVVFSLKQPDSAAMFPGRFPNVPDTMRNFGWNPQPMGLQGQFCGGDMMNQQSQAQSQAQTQAQLASLREQNSNPKPATCVTSSVSYPAPSTTHSFPSTHFAASHNFHSTYSTTNTSGVRTTSTSGTSIHTNWIQCILQS